MSNKSKQGAKKPRRVVIGIYLDDALADEASLIEQAHEKVRIELERTRPRRLAEYAAAGLEAQQALEMVQHEDTDGLGELTAKLDAARAALDEATIWFVFEAIGHRRLAAMIAQHPPTDEQKTALEARGEQARWNPETFPRALTEDSCVAPAGIDWSEVFDGYGVEQDSDELPPKGAWSHSDVEALFATAIAANQSLRTAPRERQPALRQLLGE